MRKGNIFIVLLLMAALLVVLALEFFYFNKSINNPGQSSVTAEQSSNTKGNSSDTMAQSSNTEGQSTDTAQNSNESDPVKKQIENMTVEEKIGQLIIVGVDSYNNDEHSKLLIQKYYTGGFILFKKNISNSKQLLSLLNSLKETNKINKIPLFLSVDEEGGRVSRMPEEFLKFPTNEIIGKRNNSDFSFKIGSTIGEEIKTFGFNLDFAPVLDINSNPKNPVIGNRSFGKTPELVSKLGISTMKGLMSQNIISVVKHFPGHGDTSIDSHIGLPKVDNDINRLRRFELVPFSEAIKNNAEAIMVAHILLSRLDPQNPASMSKTIISDILRKDMGFDGVVITDDFTMGAISKNYGIGSAAVKSIQAGSDIILVCHDFDKQEAVIKALYNAVESGRITTERLNESVYRILKLKQEHSLSNEANVSVDPKMINDKIRALIK